MKKLTCTVAALAFSIITCLMSMRHENVFGPGTGQVVAIIVSVIVIPLSAVDCIHRSGSCQKA